MKISYNRKLKNYKAYVRGHDGKYIQVYGKTKKEVQEKADKITSDLKTGKFVNKNNIMFTDWADEWVENYLIDVGVTTKRTYERQIRNHIKKAFKEVKLQKINHNDVQRFVQDLSKKYAPKTVRNIYLVLHRCLSDAVKNGFIGFNPSDDITLPKIEKKEINVLELDEIQTFIDLSYKLAPEYADCLEFLLLTGLRVSEFTGLTIDNYNRENHTLTIDKQYERISRTYMPPKHGGSRKITLSKRAVEIIEKRLNLIEKRRKYYNPEYDPDNVLFLNPDSERVTQQTLRKKLKKVVKELDREDFRLHDLRHTFATLTLASGTDIKTLQKIMGHTDANFTMNKYAHSTDLMNINAARNMDNLIENSYKIVKNDQKF